MSQENLDLVRSIFADWERGDYSRAEWAHPEIELVIADGPSPGTWTGRAGMVEGWSGFLTAWEGHRSHAESYRELGNDRILVLARGTGRAKRSGVEFAEGMVKSAAVFHVRDGMVTGLIVYLHRERAFADLGLKE